MGIHIDTLTMPRRKGAKKPLESRSVAQLKAKAKKRGLRVTKKDGRPKTKSQLIKALRK